MKTATKKIHFTGICGVGTSALAIAFHNAGYEVTGSDKGFFPPVSTALTDAGVPYYAGWHPEKMLADGKPDFIVAGGIGTGSTNPEIITAKDNNIPVYSFAETIGEYISKKNSIVCAGTWGKTTSSALLAHILVCAGFKPSYFCGGVPLGMNAGALDTSDWSVVEGDEYKSATWDEKAKFFHYKPTHLLLTAVSWDHADMYPTENSYFDAFEKLISTIPDSGKIVVCADNEKALSIVSQSKKEFVSYGKNKDAVYRYENVKASKDGVTFDIDYHGKKYEIKSGLLGVYNVENIVGCFALAKEIGIAPGDISDAIKSFKGMKRRLEKRFEGAVTVLDEHAHSPEKVKNALKTIRSIYSAKIIAVYEPNSGNRTPQSKPAYKNAFIDADIVVIPRLSKLKVDPKNPEKTFEGEELAETIKESHENVLYIDDDDTLVNWLCEKASNGDAVVFMGPHGFRGMIEETVKKLAEK